MLFIDDLVCFPVRGLLGLFRKIHEAAQQEATNQAEAIRTRLSELYMMLETGQITEDAFDRQEKVLLDRLDAVESPTLPPGPPDAAALPANPRPARKSRRRPRQPT